MVHKVHNDFPLMEHRFQQPRRVMLLFLGVALLISLLGCAGKSSPGSSKEVLHVIPPEFFDPHFPCQRVIIEPGDILTVRFYYHPELDSTQTVRPDGKISLTLFQAVDASNQTPEELQSTLVDKYSQEFVDPVITVEISKQASTTAFVTGEVSQGGVKALDAKTTVGQLLAQSAVNEVDGSLRSVVLVRRHSDSDYKAYLLDARLDVGAQRDIYVAPGDIIVVPRSTITLIGDFVQKYIRDIIPPQMNIYGGAVTDLGTLPLFEQR